MDVDRLLEQVVREYSENGNYGYLYVQEILHLLNVDQDSFTAGVNVGKSFESEAHGPWKENSY